MKGTKESGVRGTAALPGKNAFPNRRESSFMFLGRDLHLAVTAVVDKDNKRDLRRRGKRWGDGVYCFLAAQLWLRSSKQLLPLNRNSCPGNRMVVASYTEPVYHPESLAVTCTGGCHATSESRVFRV